MHLTHNDEDKQDGGHPRSDVEHDSDVVGQLVHVVHIRNKNGWEQEPDGTAQLQSQEHNPDTVILAYIQVMSRKITLLWTSFMTLICLNMDANVLKFRSPLSAAYTHAHVNMLRLYHLVILNFIMCLFSSRIYKVFREHHKDHRLKTVHYL